jgi:hypothetical protein
LGVRADYDHQTDSRDAEFPEVHFSPPINDQPERLTFLDRGQLAVFLR